MPKLKPSPKRVLDTDTLPEYLSAYLSYKSAADKIAVRVSEMKATLMAHLAEYGIENERGHRTIVVDGVATITRQRKAPEAFLEDEATRWLTKRGERDKVIKEVTIEEFDYDAFLALLFDEKVPQDEVDNFYETNETFAFMVTGVVDG